jgi:hypothetical protein
MTVGDELLVDLGHNKYAVYGAPSYVEADPRALPRVRHVMDRLEVMIREDMRVPRR